MDTPVGRRSRIFNSGFSGLSQRTPVDARHLTIQLVWDTSVVTNSAPAGFKPAVINAANYLSSLIFSPATISFNVGFGEVGQGSFGGSTPVSTGGQSIYNSTFSVGQTWSFLRAALVANARSPIAKSAAASLQTADISGSNGTPHMTIAMGINIGLLNPVTNAPPYSWIGFGNSTPWDYSIPTNPTGGTFDFFAAVLHEMTECMGRNLLCGTSFGNFQVYDHYRYSSAGTLQSGNETASPSYFSIDGGVTNLRNFYTGGGGIDPGDWSGADGLDACNFTTGTANTIFPFTSADMNVLDALGWNTTPGP